MSNTVFNTAFWKAALESAGQGVWDYDIRTGRRDHSDVWHHIRGQVPGLYDTPSDDEWVEGIHPDDRALAQDQTNRLNAGELAEVAYEYRERHADGHWIWIMCRGRAVEWDESGKPFRFVGTDTDISRIKASEDEVKAVSRHLELALSSVQMGVWRFDLTTEQLEWDARLKSIYGLPEDQPVPRDVWERALHPDDFDRATMAAEVAIEQHLDYDLSYRIIRPDGARDCAHGLPLGRAAPIEIRKVPLATGGCSPHVVK